MIKSNAITLKPISNNDGFIDYNILLNEKIIGLLQTVEDDRPFIFLRQIQINSDYKRNGYAKHVINSFVESHDKIIRFTIALNSESAISFWNNYLKNTSYNINHVKGSTWDIFK